MWLKITAGFGTEPGQPAPEGEVLTALVEAPAHRDLSGGVPVEWWPEAREARRRSLAAAERGDTVAAEKAASWLGGLVKAASVCFNVSAEQLHEQVRQAVPAGTVPLSPPPDAALYGEGLTVDPEPRRRPVPPGWQKPVPQTLVVEEPATPDLSPRVTRDPLTGELVASPVDRVVSFEGSGLPARSPGGRPLKSGGAVRASAPHVQRGGE